MELPSSSIGESQEPSQQQSQPHEYQYTEQLSQMLYGLGDFPTPSPDTVRLLEDYLWLRLGRWAQSAAAAADTLCQAEVTPESLVAALRPNKRALAQCVTFHRLLAGVSLAASLADGGDDEDTEREVAVAEIDYDGGADTEEVNRQAAGPQLPAYLEAAAAEASDELPRLQAERQARMSRLDRCSESLSGPHYDKFARCRRCSLLSRVSGSSVSDFARLRRWLGRDGHRLNNRACHLLSYLGSQTVAELLDIVKQRRAESWPADALELEAELCASPAEMREAMQLRRLRMA